jgi:hypothetical protein
MWHESVIFMEGVYIYNRYRQLTDSAIAILWNDSNRNIAKLVFRMSQAVPH